MRSLLILVMMLGMTGCATGQYYVDPSAMAASSQIFTNWMNQDRPNASRPQQCFQNIWKDYSGTVHTDMVCR